MQDGKSNGANPLLIGAVILAGLLGLFYRFSSSQNRRIGMLERELSRVSKARDEALARASLETREVSSLQASLAAATPARDEKFEDALAPWLAKVHRLEAYLNKHPEKRIPQMDLLVAADWLDATKASDLKSEADLRRVLGQLRGLARQKVSWDIGQALKKVMAENGGVPPANLQTLLPYLPGTFNPAILQELVPNPTGTIPGLRGGDRIYFVDKPVDDLWDATMFYIANGGVGSRTSSAPNEDVISRDIFLFTQANGAPPTAAAQLQNYPGVERVDPNKLQEMVEAYSSTPDL
jgi:hypothetical protein